MAVHIAVSLLQICSLLSYRVQIWFPNIFAHNMLIHLISAIWYCCQSVALIWTLRRQTILPTDFVAVSLSHSSSCFALLGNYFTAWRIRMRSNLKWYAIRFVRNVENTTNSHRSYSSINFYRLENFRSIFFFCQLISEMQPIFYVQRHSCSTVDSRVCGFVATKTQTQFIKSNWVPVRKAERERTRERERGEIHKAGPHSSVCECFECPLFIYFCGCI